MSTDIATLREIGFEERLRRSVVLIALFSPPQEPMTGDCNEAGAIPALGFGTLIPDPIATRNATKAALEAGFRALEASPTYWRILSSLGMPVESAGSASMNSLGNDATCNHAE